MNGPKNDPDHDFGYGFGNLFAASNAGAHLVIKETAAIGRSLAALCARGGLICHAAAFVGRQKWRSGFQQQQSLFVGCHPYIPGSLENAQPFWIGNSRDGSGSAGSFLGVLRTTIENKPLNLMFFIKLPWGRVDDACRSG